MPRDEEAAAEIIGEDESRREENVKHFLRSDGSYTAVQYRKPVHYRETDEDAWQDIDNTLVPDVQPPEPAPGEETGSLSGETGDDPAASEDPVAPSAEAVWYVPASSPVDVAFAQDSACESLVRYQSGEYTLAWRYARTAASVVTGEQESFAPEESAERDGAEFYLEALSGGIVYRNLLPNIDVEYVVTSNLLKENLILKSRAVQSAIVAVYEIGNLQAEQKSATEIALKDGDKTVFTIVAPVMMDASEAQSTALTMTILSEANGELRLRLNADRAWLDAPERVYPVTIDPYIHEGIVDYADDESALYTTPSSGRPYGTLVVGKNSDYGKCRSYMKFDLPTLEAGDMVIGGTLNAAQYSGSYGFSAVGKTSMQINAYQVLSSWTESSIQNSSAFSGLPQCDTAVMDYVKVGEKSEMGWVSLDVTQAVRDWYGGVSPNYGLCLQSEAESDYAVACFVASNNYSYPTATPTLTVSYLNNKGLEDRWTYHAQSVGEKCTTYVNDYTGNLVTIADIASSSGSIAPFTIQAVYNGYQKGKYAETPTKIGKGFRLSISQTMVQITDGPDALSKALYKAGFRYKYTDGDGTVHYFKAKKDTTDQFEDEEGLGLTLKVLGDANLVEGQKYELASDKGGKITFLKSGKLRAVYDTDGNRYRLTYNESGTVFRVYDSAERHFSFTYDANNNVTKITDPAGREITFTYDESVRIKTLTYPDGTTNNFRWSNSRMRLARGTDGRMIAFGYPESGDEATISRVTKITEYDKSGTQETANGCGHIEIDYGRNRYTKFTDHKGRTEKYLFDRVGRTVNVVAADGSITTAGYTGTSGKTAHRIKKLTTGTKHVNNLLKNHSFESDSASWNLTDAAVATDKAYLGNKAAKVTQAGRISQPCYNVASGTYTASAWIKTGAATTNAVVRMRAYDANSSYLGEAMSEPITYVTDWERRHVTWTLPENTAHIRVEVVTSGAGTAWQITMTVQETPTGCTDQRT